MRIVTMRIAKALRAPASMSGFSQAVESSESHLLFFRRSHSSPKRASELPLLQQSHYSARELSA